MNTFLKTFFACLILCLGFIAYKCFNEDSYSPDIKIDKVNSLFSVQHKDELSKPDVNEDTTNERETEKPAETPKPEKKKYSYNCYFYTNSGQPVALKRELETPVSLDTAIILLLKGPLITESKKGYYSEIPPGVNLLGVKKDGKKVIVDLSSKFGDGGGTESIENRLKQLSKTIKAIEPDKNIYLYINGKEVEYLGGEGVYVKQPL